LGGEGTGLLDKVFCQFCFAYIPGVICFNDKSMKLGNPVYLSIRTEKLHLSHDTPEKSHRRNMLPAVVEDMIYLG